ncbi:hypothetical protein [Nostoc sp. KVJ20]|uniref:hypothetical protein n=1 Tax=Nostoc sp. KVJ20 TaxID=457944 RepID=UPI00114C878D|nr:hypothetical protein [Nostoc sp. KVJ20]
MSPSTQFVLTYFLLKIDVRTSIYYSMIILSSERSLFNVGKQLRASAITAMLGNNNKYEYILINFS